MQTTTPEVSEETISAVMKKYDRESNTRIWEGKAKLLVTMVLVAFSLWCIWVTLFATFLEEIRLTSFMGLIILMGFLIYPAKKGEQRPNHIPWYDLIFMILGTGSYLYFTFQAIINTILYFYLFYLLHVIKIALH
ncbi:MAG: hypothetical protein II566_09220, partial [Lachnospiraceae bacterium]|nr:hypothetical protein [Lachnospiraceae bacterium]